MCGGHVMDGDRRSWEKQSCAAIHKGNLSRELHTNDRRHIPSGKGFYHHHQIITLISMLFVSLCLCVSVLCILTIIVHQTEVSMAFNEWKKCTFSSAKLDKPRVCVCQCILKFPTAIGFRPSASFCGKVNRCYVCGSKSHLRGCQR